MPVLCRQSDFRRPAGLVLMLISACLCDYVAVQQHRIAQPAGAEANTGHRAHVSFLPHLVLDLPAVLIAA